MISYQGAEREFYAEALRAVAAVASARARNDGPLNLLTVKALMMTGDELGVDRMTAWSILYTASQVTISSLVEHIADLEDTEGTEVTERMVFAAMESVATGAL